MTGVEISFIFVIGVFIAGIVTFLAPCTFPLVPAFMAFIGGVSVGDAKELTPAIRRKIITNSIFYVLGFGAVFIAFGILAGLAGSAIPLAREVLTRIGGAIVILFGLYLFGVFKFKLFSGTGLGKIGGKFKSKGPLSSFAFGASFGAGWSPCIGPIVGTVLLLTASEGSVLTGAALLAVFSLGLGIPFILTAVFMSKATKLFKKLERHLNWINKGSGILMIGLGLLLVTNNLDLLIAWGFRALQFLNYEESLLNYL